MTSSFHHFLDQFIQFLGRRTGKIVTAVTISFLLIIILLPPVISYVVKDWLQQNGADEAQINDVDFNVFSGQLEFNKLRVTVSKDYTFVLEKAFINIDWLPLFKKQFQIKEVFVENTDITLEKLANGNLSIGGITPAQKKPVSDNVPAKEDTLWKLGLNKLSITNSKLHYQQPQLDLALHIDNATLTGLQSWTQTPAQLSLDGKINGSALHIDSQLMPFAAQPAFNADLRLQSLELSNFSLLMQPQVKALSGRLSLNSKINGIYHSGEGLQIQNDGEISLHKLNLLNDKLQVKNDAFLWSGSLQVKLPENTPPQISLRGNVTAEVTSIQDAEAQAQAAPLLNVGMLKLSKLLFENNGLHINSINVKKMQAQLLRNKEGKLAILDRLASPVEKTVDSKAPETTTENNNKQTLAIRIDDILINENSSLIFEDLSTSPTFKSTLHLDNFKLSGLDSKKPEQAGNFSVKGKIGQFSSLSSEGKVYPFLSQLGLNMTARLEAVELPPLTSYTSGAIGYKLITGQLQSDINVDIKNNKLDGESKLVLNNMEVLALTPAEKKAINTTTDMSLELGLSLLRDRDNNVELTIPFKGDMDNPQFDISDAINQAIGTAGAGFLKLALQPFGAILMIADIASSAANSVQLQPMLFSSGSAEIDATALQYHERMAKLLGERPQLRIKLCGIATQSDRDYFVAQALAAIKKKQPDSKKLPIIPDEKLLELATSRANTSKALFISLYKINADRLFNCHSKIDTAPDASPRIELGI